MTDTNPQAKVLEPDEIRSQAASLAAHLDRSGVHCLPKPRAEAVELLGEKFAHPAAAVETETKPVVVTPTASIPSASTAGAPDRPAPATPARRFESIAPVDAAQGAYPGPMLPLVERQEQLDVINGEVSVCTRCEILSNCRTKTVFGEGSVSPRVVFFGEGPGAEEDRTGRPFVGKAGDLLTKMIEACTFRREDVYILNTVKCRPPANRNPEHDETENCREYYQRQLAVLRPEYIVCLGAISSQELLRSKLSVGRLRGKFHRYFESKVLVTYHPAYLLRNPAAKKATWTDLQLMLRDAGIEL